MWACILFWRGLICWDDNQCFEGEVLYCQALWSLTAVNCAVVVVVVFGRRGADDEKLIHPLPNINNGSLTHAVDFKWVTGATTDISSKGQN